jgi:hypothetical protein
MSSAVAINLVQGGAVVPYFAGATTETVFQNFDGTGTVVTPIPAEPFDLGGLTLNFDDITGQGSWIVY